MTAFNYFSIRHLIKFGKMTFALRLILCVFLALNITPNDTTKSVLRISYDNVEDLEKLWEIGRDLDKNVEENYVRRDIQGDTINTDSYDTKLLNTEKKPILRGGFDNKDKLEMLRAVVQVVDRVNEDAYNNRYEEKYNNKNTQTDDSYEEENDNQFVDRDSSSEDGQSIEEVQNESLNKLLAMLLLNDNPNTYHSESSERNYSFKSHSYNQLDNLNSSIRDDMLRKKKSKSSIWKTCGKRAAKYCRKACQDVINSNCSSCKRRLKKRLKKECKVSCKDRFSAN